jgi:hypothetical protein
VLASLLFVASLLTLYFIIRKAVSHGILDAEETRRRREREQRFEEALGKGSVDVPTT